MNKYKVRDTILRFRLLMTLPNVWVSIVIALLAVLSLFISMKLNQSEKAYASSVFSNVFAGLVTGFAISILSGVKSMHCAHLEAKLSWLDETHKMILEFINTHHQLYSVKKGTYEEYSELADDALCKANDVNEHILHEPFDKVKWFDPDKYFRQSYGYDATEKSDIINDFRYTLMSFDCSVENRMNLVEAFKPIFVMMLDLNKQILDDIRLLDMRLLSSKKSII